MAKIFLIKSQEEIHNKIIIITICETNKEDSHKIKE
jgi:hypothetical protein